MNHFRSSLLAVLAVTASSAHAEVSTPRQVADRPAAHCQAPRFAPDGTHLGTVLTGQATANCGFGDDGTTLYMTADSLLCRVRLATVGPLPGP